MREITHVLLAGDRNYAPYLLEGRNKCFLEFSDRKLFDLTMDALHSSSRVERLMVVGPEILRPFVPKRFRENIVRFLPQQSSFSQNVCAAIESIHSQYPESSAVFITNDAPLLSGAELDTFAEFVAEHHGQLSVAVSRIPTSQLTDPLVREYVRSMVITSNGLYLLANQIAVGCITGDVLPHIQRLFELRKQSLLNTVFSTVWYVLQNQNLRSVLCPWLRLVFAKRLWLLNPQTKLIDSLTLSLTDIERKLENIFQAELQVNLAEIPNAFGCFDADTPQQLHQLRQFIAQEREAAAITLEIAHA